ncbi:hypothetical protein C8R44DRAFT_865949 [Mycena epipterygia]|nr:hypothetical protein C8R44DRAFT_865949 [Mycena epipterygia]
MRLRSSRTVGSGFRMFGSRPELCTHIRTPELLSRLAERNTPISDEWVALIVMGLARIGSLTHLRSFDWDGREMPRDSLWRALRTACPELTEIFSNVGSRPLGSDSELFKFSGLISFLLSVRHGLPNDRTGLPAPEPSGHVEYASHALPRPHHAHAHLGEGTGRWRLLTALTLGAFGYMRDFSLVVLPAANWHAFLAARSKIKPLRLARNFGRWISPEENTIARVLSGVFDLTCEPLYASRAPTLCAALRLLPALARLDIWVQMPAPDALARHGDWDWEDISGAYPAVEELGFMCTTRFGKRPLTVSRLMTFVMTKGDAYVDEGMRTSGRRVFSNVLSNQNIAVVVDFLALWFRLLILVGPVEPV